MFKKKVFLDYAAITPVSPWILKAVYKIEKKYFANPSSLYDDGLDARKILKESRKLVADSISARPSEIIFTGSGTEANNLALMGVINTWNGEGRPHVVTLNIEHPAILETCNFLETQDVFVTKVNVKENGIVDPKDIRDALTPNTVLVSVMYVNNEIGTIQPIKEIAKVIRNYRKDNNYPYFHTDASQAPLYCEMNREKLGIDMMTLDSIKIYGPRGIGMLYIKDGIRISPVMYGGGQERGLRPGTENLPAIYGFSLALQSAVQNQEKEKQRLGKLQKYFFDELKSKFKDKIIVNGDIEKRSPNNINICIKKVDTEFVVIRLNEMGIACSSASACATLKDNSGSYVIGALGQKGKECFESSIRFTMGIHTKKSHIDKVIFALQKII